MTVIDAETELKDKKQLEEIKLKLERLINKEVINLECIRVPNSFYAYIKGLTEDNEYFYFRAFKEDEILNIEIQNFLKEYTRYLRKKRGTKLYKVGR